MEIIEAELNRPWKDMQTVVNDIPLAILNRLYKSDQKICIRS